MLTHADIWNAIDRLALRAGLSASGLAKKAGLDPTTFNKSKRITPEGRQRWPSTESIAKSLAATGVTLEAFVALISERAGAGQVLPLVGLAEAGAGGCFDDSGHPSAKGWDAIAFPAMSDAHAYALEIAGDALHPAYRDGTVVVVSPAAPIRRGDRVVVSTCNGAVTIEELKRRTAKSIELRALGAGAAERTLGVDEVRWIARVMWASQ